MAETTTALGFIGIGLMGRPMALRLLAAGYPVTVWNRSAEKLAAVVDAGANAASSPAEVARRANVVFLCVSDARAVEAVVFGPDGVAAGAARGKLLIDLSSIGVAETRAMAARLDGATGMRWIDAPVSGGVPGAESGTLAIMAGGRAADVERIRPILAHLSRRLTHMGDNGAGQIAKICNQIIVSCGLAVIAEAMALAERSGIDAGRLPEALAGGFADSIPFQLFAPRMVERRFAPPLGHLATMHKDAENASTLAESVGADLPMTERALGVYRAAMGDGHATDDVAALITRYL